MGKDVKVCENSAFGVFIQLKRAESNELIFYRPKANILFSTGSKFGMFVLVNVFYDAKMEVANLLAE